MKLCTYIRLLLAALIVTNAHAQILQCVGIDDDGNTINAVLDPATETLNINGQIHNINGVTAGHNGVTTENYITVEGAVTYVSVAKSAPRTIEMFQFNAATDDLITEIPLACHK